MKIIFAGTSDFGIPTLERIKDQISLIITQPDRQAGRKKAVLPSPVKLWALKRGIALRQPEKIAAIKDELSALQPDLLLVAAYGQIIPRSVLDVPKFGSINIHASFLPFYRGPTPIQTALLNGDDKTGLTLIKMDEKMDHGPILIQQNCLIERADDYDTLSKKLAETAAGLVADFLPKWFAGVISETEQDHARATYTKFYRLEDGRIDWTKPAAEIFNKVRALGREPGVWTKFGNKSVKILKATPYPESRVELPGKIYGVEGKTAVKCKDMSLVIEILQPEGKKPMTGHDFLNGLKNSKDKIFI